MAAETALSAAVLSCDMTQACTRPVAMLDQQGYVYCEHHGLVRRTQPGRKLRPAELRKLERGEAITKY